MFSEEFVVYVVLVVGCGGVSFLNSDILNIESNLKIRILKESPQYVRINE